MKSIFAIILSFSVIFQPALAANSSIDFLRTRGAIKSENFDISAPVTRAELAKFATIIANVPSAKKCKFKDIFPSEWQHPFACTANTRGALLPHTGKFSPDAVLTRIAALHAIFQIFDQKYTANAKSAMSDVPKNAWFAPLAIRALELNLVDLKNGKFLPQKITTRAEAAKMIEKMHAHIFAKRKAQKNDVIFEISSAPADGLDLLREIRRIIDAEYLRDVKNEIDLTRGAIKGLVDSLGDRHTTFFTPDENTDFMDQLNENLVGIGAYVDTHDGYPVVTAPIDGSPASRAGIRTDDLILQVDDHKTFKKDLREVVKWIRGPENTKVKLKIRRGNSEHEITIIRAKINLQIVTSAWKPHRVAYIRITDFTDDAPKNFAKELGKYSKTAKGLIIDLRGNPGGFLDAAIDITSFWLPVNSIVSRLRDKNAEETLYLSNRAGILQKMPTIVLLDSGSASASEILAGALRDHQKAKIVGQKSYGKGTAQTVISFSDGSSLKLTIAEWLTPHGIGIDGIGITPDFNITNDPSKTGDPQLQKAINLLQNN